MSTRYTKEELEEYFFEAGIGYGKNARPAKHEILVGKNKWVSKKEWQAAIRARKNGTATNEQKEMLDNGHWLSGRRSNTAADTSGRENYSLCFPERYHRA